ncbi:CBU_0592 family membrane protein [Dyadobacter diqingensis]|uniref:CBU_0592 family membrane protein n=1 Tax=Dyadobacter diqingensis TaxID=2938121 RepID=UPI0020C47071|nr:hypothetical protein [Dyadobacter diqingensis]
MDNKVIEFAGWLGVIFYVFAYLLLSTGMLKANSYRFHSLNILGAIGLIINSAYYGDKPNLVVNVIWLIIGIFAIYRRYLHLSLNK